MPCIAARSASPRSPKTRNHLHFSGNGTEDFGRLTFAPCSKSGGDDADDKKDEDDEDAGADKHDGGGGGGEK